jgi:DNA polymerase I-like protein with 3'-5' exonuclease and polymerase domains
MQQLSLFPRIDDQLSFETLRARRGPALQNIPVRTEIGRQVSEAFEHDHEPISASYEEIETRLAATLADDESH